MPSSSELTSTGGAALRRVGSAAFGRNGVAIAFDAERTTNETNMPAAFNRLPDPALLVASDGSITWANHAALDSTEEPFEEPLGRPFEAMWPKDAGPAVRQALHDAATGGTGRFRAVPVWFSIGDEAPREWDVAISAHEGGCLAMCRDLGGVTVEKAQGPSGPSLDEAFRQVEHRLNNLFSIMPSIVKMSMRYETDPQALQDAMIDRITALTKANGLALTLSALRSGIALDTMIETVLDGTLLSSGRIVVSGPPVQLATRGCNTVALTLHELATNALRHGALSASDGRVRFAWALEPKMRDRELPEHAVGCLRLLWTEVGGPTIDGAPSHRGFGTRTVDRMVASQEGTIEREWLRNGLSVTIDLPVYDLGEEPKFGPNMRRVAPQASQAEATAVRQETHEAELDPRLSTGAPHLTLVENTGSEAPSQPVSTRDDAAFDLSIVRQIDRILSRR